MKIVSYSKFRQNLKNECEWVCENHDIIVLTRQSGQNIVIMSEKDFSALDETAYLLRTQKNRHRLQSALRERKGRVFESIAEIKNEFGL